MNTTKNIQIVSLYFFLVTGMLHFFSGLMYVNGYYPETTLLINKVTDLPLLASGLFYLLSSIKLAISPEKHKTLDIGLIATGSIIFIAVLIINLVLKDIQ